MQGLLESIPAVFGWRWATAPQRSPSITGPQTRRFSTLSWFSEIHYTQRISHSSTFLLVTRWQTLVRRYTTPPFFVHLMTHEGRHVSVPSELFQCVLNTEKRCSAAPASRIWSCSFCALKINNQLFLSRRSPGQTRLFWQLFKKNTAPLNRNSGPATNPKTYQHSQAPRQNEFLA